MATYRYKGAWIFLLSVAVAFGYESFLAYSIPEVRTLSMVAVALLIDVTLVIAYIETKTFFFTFNGNSITTGSALHTKTFEVSEITCVQVVPSRGGASDSSLYLWKKRRVLAKVFNYAEDFQGLIDRMQSVAAGTGAEFKQTRLREREKKRGW